MTSSRLALILLIVLPWAASAQNVGIGTTAPHDKALLDLTSSNKGFLVPRMTALARITIGSPPTGLTVYQTDGTSGYYYYDGAAWKRLARADELSGAGTWTAVNDDQYSNVDGDVGIGTTTPSSKLHLVGNMLQENGTIRINNPNGIIEFENAGVDKGFLQLSGNNLRIGTHGPNAMGKLVMRLNGEDRIFADSTGNMMIIGEQDASLTTHGYLQLGPVSETNLIMDRNEILARNNGASSPLFLQHHGGDLQVGSTPRMIIKDNGKVGLGIASPLNMLHLEGGNMRINYPGSTNGTPNPAFIYMEVQAEDNKKAGLRFTRDGLTKGEVAYLARSGAPNIIRLDASESSVDDLVITDGGRTGLNMNEFNTPAALLHLRQPDGLDALAIHASLASNNPTLQFYSTSNSQGGPEGTKKGFLQLSDGHELRIGTNAGNTTGRFIIRNNGTDRMFVTAEGNVGIGNSAPSTKLQVAGKLRVDNDGEAIQVSGNTPSIKIGHGGIHYSTWEQSFELSTLSSSADLKFASPTRVRFDAPKVTIGDLPPGAGEGYLLTVDGKVLCEELRVELSQNWPDYVFRNDYDLMPITDLRDHIRSHGHLPGIPDAATAEAVGIDVGEMNRLLLEKVEQLTLYVIQLQEQIDDLRMSGERQKTGQ